MAVRVLPWGHKSHASSCCCLEMILRRDPGDRSRFLVTLNFISDGQTTSILDGIRFTMEEAIAQAGHQAGQHHVETIYYDVEDDRVADRRHAV